jgi:hypothetical protein
MNLTYERDLTAMKYAILKGPYHAKIILTLAEELGIQPHRLRKHLIATLDMITLESMGPRYDSAQTFDEPDEIKRTLNYELFTRFIPVIPVSVMDQAVLLAKKQIHEGYYEPDAIITAKNYIAAEIFP